MTSQRRAELEFVKSGEKGSRKRAGRTCECARPQEESQFSVYKKLCIDLEASGIPLLSRFLEDCPVLDLCPLLALFSRLQSCLLCDPDLIHYIRGRLGLQYTGGFSESLRKFGVKSFNQMLLLALKIPPLNW